MLRRTALLLLLAVSSATASAAAGLPASGAGASGPDASEHDVRDHAATPRVLRLGNAGEPETLDPHRYNLRLEETLLTDLFLGLTTFDAAGRTVPGAAERWDTSADGLTWTFHLRPGLRWSDGRPLVAADFVYAFRRLQDPRTAASLAYFMYPLANAAEINAGKLPPDALGAAAPDDRTLVLTLARPYPYLPERLLYPTGFPVPAHVIDAVGDDWIKPEHWVSNGAFTLADWRPQDAIELVPNRHFAASGLAPAQLDRVIYLPLANEQTAYNRYRAGDVDAIGSFPSGDLPKIRQSWADDLRLSPLLSIMYLVFNTRTAPFDDARVREALALAIERDMLVGPVQRAENTASSSFVPALVADYTPASMPGVDLPQADRHTRARALLAAAGYNAERPLTVTLRHMSGTETKRSMLAVASFWRAIGVRTTLHQSELKVHFADLRRGDFEVALAGWFGENNPEHYLGLWGSATGDVNYGAYRDAAFDQRMAAAAQEPNLARRNALLAEAESVGAAGFPVVPLHMVTVRRLVSPRIDGWVDNPRDVHPARLLRLH
jgi:oligopeptide transport system substrate-binding protein